jgi:hypothetical protein
MEPHVNNYKVQLIPIASLQTGSYGAIANSRVVFEVTPTFAESRTAEYSAVSPVHMPGSIQMYQRTSSRTFTIGAKLISRTSQEAVQNKQYLQTLRAWLMPYFGSTNTLQEQQIAARANLDAATLQLAERNSTKTDKEKAALHNTIDAARMNVGVQLTGAPPDVLYLYAYSTGANYESGLRTASTANINRVPVVLTSLNITYPDDVDYIPVTENISSVLSYVEPFPIHITVDLNLSETHSPNEFERFDLNAYKTGTLANF